ncbi:DUF2157 domain-containing protein [Tianweitania sp. BSSL-BM11]|uniref:DUF2157 domain-containing protein n=1 Tax=Tianweitania aestuarii TaxID=2814886 RepID=A0ABS5RWJ9_9HYPH|nr:DUF2157 domain-containing protein [Tianweitania aestuarii]MBS9720661.1 DUF2157 domain-containing protein [Tianweitania aestuarii]
MASYVNNVKAEITRWTSAGLIDAETALRLTNDLEARRGKGISFGSVIGGLAAILLAAAILLFVAANWEAIPRLVRVALLFVLIAAGYIGGAVTKLRGAVVWGESLYMIAAAAFGASIALIGQMYHITGDEVQAIAIWAAGTAFASAMLRSPILTVGSVMLAAFWLVSSSNGIWSSAQPSIWFLPAALVLWVLSFWTGSPYGRVLIALSLLLYGTLLTMTQQASPIVPTVMASLSVAVFVFAVFRPGLAERAARLGAALPVLGLFGFLLSMALLQLMKFEQLGTAFFLAVVVFAGVIAALLTGGRESRRLRRLAYAGFAVELIYLYAVYLGTMLDTASFFLASGLVLAIIAVAIRRFEKEFGRDVTEPADMKAGETP